jgi:hypothetical protein
MTRSRLWARKIYFIKSAVSVFSKTFFGLGFFLPLAVLAQIDPVKRDLVQAGYNQPVEGRAPIAAYAYYYHNEPDFLRTNLTLRLALAPVYADSELGWVRGLGPRTDYSLGFAGGGFADSYNELRGGKFIEDESFEGHSAEVSGNIYHRFNPEDLIPLNLVLHGAAHYSFYDNLDKTAANFARPSDGATFRVRTGLRYGGIEPTLFPELAMELAAWYQGEFRTDDGVYGFAGDRRIERTSHLFWASAALSYTLPASKQNIFLRLITGTSVNADRLGAYRLGGFLPLVAEYPLSLPGFFFQELSAKQFALLNASYLLPLTRNQRWNLELNGATAGIDYLSGTAQAGHWVNGVGAGILYRSPSDKFKGIIAYAYGVDAIRSSGRGASSVSVLLQWDLEKTYGAEFNPTHPGQWRGLQRLFGR